jgi:hypothetical protein
MRRAARLALAAALAGCAGPAAEAPPAPPEAAAAPAAEATTPPAPERARFEAWERANTGADPREGFARAAEAEAERQREAALASGGVPAPLGSVETEMLEDRLRELVLRDGGCLETPPDPSLQDDWITHRALTRADFEAQERQDVESVVDVPDSEFAAYVAIRFVCIAQPRLSEPQPGLFVAEVDDIEYLALLSRRLSWWNPEGLGHDEWILRHEQLHFDVAELFAKELTRSAPARRAQLRGTGANPPAAIEALQEIFSTHMREQRERFERFEVQYDRETRHGTDYPRQTEWYGRVKRGLGAVRSGLDVPPTLDRALPPR